MKQEDYFERIQSVTQETGRVIGNALKSIYTRLEGVEEVKSALQDVGINTDRKNVEEVLEELQSKWSEFSKETKQKLSVKIAGRYNMSRFYSMMGEE